MQSMPHGPHVCSAEILARAVSRSCSTVGVAMPMKFMGPLKPGAGARSMPTRYTAAHSFSALPVPGSTVVRTRRLCTDQPVEVVANRSSGPFLWPQRTGEWLHGLHLQRMRQAKPCSQVSFDMQLRHMTAGSAQRRHRRGWTSACPSICRQIWYKHPVTARKPFLRIWDKETSSWDKHASIATGPALALLQLGAVKGFACPIMHHQLRMMHIPCTRKVMRLMTGSAPLWHIEVVVVAPEIQNQIVWQSSHLSHPLQHALVRLYKVTAVPRDSLEQHCCSLGQPYPE